MVHAVIFKIIRPVYVDVISVCLKFKLQTAVNALCVFFLLLDLSDVIKRAYSQGPLWFSCRPALFRPSIYKFQPARRGRAAPSVNLG